MPITGLKRLLNEIDNLKDGPEKTVVKVIAGQIKEDQDKKDLIPAVDILLDDEEYQVVLDREARQKAADETLEVAMNRHTETREKIIKEKSAEWEKYKEKYGLDGDPHVSLKISHTKKEARIINAE